MTNIIVGTLFDKRLVEHHLSVMASGQISLRYPFLVILVLVISAAADPDPLQDFCVGILKQSETQDINLNGLPCKDIREVTVDDFVYEGIRTVGNLSATNTGFASTSMNVGHGPAVLLGSFNSENPGSLKLPFTLFGSGIEDHLLQKAFYLSKKEVKSLKSKFGPKA
ncbi:hypothetical protein SUGI_1199820 [Cryptomeria japonica]|nr:hypothetical protein SUGI_1199820 [Cryptomeria japonica]